MPEPAAPSFLFVFAHPDDETFAVGGTIRTLADHGVPCHLYCATSGDAGRSSGIAVADSRALGALRREELRTAAQILGIKTVTISAWPDGALATADPAETIGEIVSMIRMHQPRVVVTFGPEGAPTGHRDHSAISRFATAAYFLAASSTAYSDQLSGGLTPHEADQLWYFTWPPYPESERLQRGQEPIHLTVDVAPHAEIRREAFYAHRTQRELEGQFERLANNPSESFFLAHARAPSARTAEQR